MNGEQKAALRILKRYPRKAVNSLDGQRLYFIHEGVMFCLTCQGMKYDFREMNRTEIDACILDFLIRRGDLGFPRTVNAIRSVHG